jgi:hypothetical protein
VSNTDQVILTHKKHPYRVYREEMFEAAFTNEACAAMHAIYLQTTTKGNSTFYVISPGRDPVAARRYRMNSTGNRIEGLAA